MLKREDGQVFQNASEGTKALLALALALATLPVASYLANIINGAMGEGSSLEWLLVLSYYPTVWALYFILLRLFRLRLTADNKPIASAFLGAVVGFGLIFPINLLLVFLREKYLGGNALESPLQQIQEQASAWPSFVPLLANGLLAPAAEELVFRAFLAQQMRKVVRPIFAILIAGCAFALMHGLTLDLKQFQTFFLVDFGPLVLAGLVFGMLFFRYGYISAVVAHSVFNLRPHYADFFLDNMPLFIFVSLVGGSITCLLFISHIRGIKHEN